MTSQETEQQSTSANTTPLATPSAIPPPIPVETHPNRGQFRPPSRASTDPTRLAPEDVYKYVSPPRLRPLHEITSVRESSAVSAAAAALRPAVASLRAPPAIPPVAARLEQERSQRSASRKRRQQPRVWKKLLWIKQHGFPDNYTDTEKFLDHLQWNPRLRPYTFWPLVENSIVIVQHVCSVAIFVSAYAGIYQDRLSPVAVVTCGTIATLVGWVMWDRWMGEEEAEGRRALEKALAEADDGHISVAASHAAAIAKNRSSSFLNNHIDLVTTKRGLGLSLSTSNLSSRNGDVRMSMSRRDQSLSRASIQSSSPVDSVHEAFPDVARSPARQDSLQTYRTGPPQPPIASHRNQVRLKTFKSALLIYFALLGISPILKSLTKSTSSDSIWALATWLLIINIFFFDYRSVYVPEDKSKTAATTKPSTSTSPVLGKEQARLRSISVATPAGAGTIGAAGGGGGGGAGAGAMSYSAPPFPSSLSTNAALMASTVLASRLPTTTSVFSLSLFSIQVFGLFPVFRRHLKHKSPTNLYILLTFILIGTASCGLFLILSQSYTHTYGDCGYCWGWMWHVFVRSVAGITVGGVSVMFVMGACSWWLINMQRYKNVVIGPWDPARPVLAGGGGVSGRARPGID